MVLRCSDRISRVPPYLIRPIMLPIRGYHPYCAAFQLLLVTLMARLVPVRSPLLREYHIDFLSSGYLDVSVPRVCFFNPMYSGQKYLFYLISECRKTFNNKVSSGFPHSEIHGSKLILSSSWLIAEYHVFHRLLLPRHPPNALFALDLIQKT